MLPFSHAGEAAVVAFLQQWPQVFEVFFDGTQYMAQLVQVVIDTTSMLTVPSPPQLSHEDGTRVKSTPHGIEVSTSIKAKASKDGRQYFCPAGYHVTWSALSHCGGTGLPSLLALL